jgi:hypothetical protein
MKVWLGYGSEHSSKLVIIGEFASDVKAKEVLALFDKAQAVVMEDYKAGRIKDSEITRKFSDGIMGLAEHDNFSILGYGDPEQLMMEYHAERIGNKIKIRTDEFDTNAVMKFLIHGGAKIEIFSTHEFDPQGKNRRSRT